MIYIVNEPHFQGQRLEDKDWMILDVPKHVPCRQHEGMLQTCRDGRWSTAGGCVASAQSWPHLVSLILGTPDLAVALLNQRVLCVAPPEAYADAPMPDKSFRFSGGVDGQSAKE